MKVAGGELQRERGQRKVVEDYDDFPRKMENLASIRVSLFL